MYALCMIVILIQMLQGILPLQISLCALKTNVLKILYDVTTKIFKFVVRKQFNFLGAVDQKSNLSGVI